MTGLPCRRAGWGLGLVAVILVAQVGPQGWVTVQLEAPAERLPLAAAGPVPSPFPAAAPHSAGPSPPDPLMVCANTTHDPLFQTTLCFSPNGCRGNLTIHRTQCPPYPDNVADDPVIRRLIHDSGPDTFRVRLEGPQVLMVRPRPAARCRYLATFRLTAAGPYALQAFTVFLWFQGKADPMYGKPRYEPRSVAPPQTSLQCVAPEPEAAPGRPRCATLAEAGRWGRRPTAARRLAWPVLDWLPPFEAAYRIKFAQRWGNNLMWQPDHCHYQNYSQDELLSRLEGRRFLFLGDSQTRTIFYATVNALHVNKVLGNPKIVDQNPNHQGWIEFRVRRGVVLRYTLDNLLADPAEEHSQHYAPLVRSTAREWDVLVTGTGNWAMCGHLMRQGVGRWPLRRYHAAVDRIAAQLSAYARRTGTRVVWHQQPAFPWLPDTYRNNARIPLFNAYAAAAMQRHGIEVFDTFSISDGMLHTAVGYPAGHFNDYHVRDNWARILLSHLAATPAPAWAETPTGIGTTP